MDARLSRLSSSSDLPENIGPHITSILPLFIISPWGWGKKFSRTVFSELRGRRGLRLGLRAGVMHHNAPVAIIENQLSVRYLRLFLWYIKSGPLPMFFWNWSNWMYRINFVYFIYFHSYYRVFFVLQYHLSQLLSSAW